MSFIEFNNVKKIYKMGNIKIKALTGTSFKIEKGEFVVIAGPSGAGKSTILNLLGGMDTTTTGEIIVDGNKISEYTNKQLTTYRRFDIGFVFQFYNLIINEFNISDKPSRFRLLSRSNQCFLQEINNSLSEPKAIR